MRHQLRTKQTDGAVIAPISAVRVQPSTTAIVPARCPLLCPGKRISCAVGPNLPMLQQRAHVVRSGKYCSQYTV